MSLRFVIACSTALEYGGGRSCRHTALRDTCTVLFQIFETNFKQTRKSLGHTAEELGPQAHRLLTIAFSKLETA